MEQRFHQRSLPILKEHLWQGDHLVAWIGEAERRTFDIAKRTLFLRWGPPVHASTKEADHV